MRYRCFTVLVVPLVLLSLFSMGYAQSTNCVVIEKRDTTVIVSCADGSTQNLNIGGASGLYRQGDRIDISGTSKSQASPTTVGPRDPGTRDPGIGAR